MESSVATLMRLRKMINDMDSKDGTFADEELEAILIECDSIYKAAAEAWMIKASLLQGDIESYSAGNESYNLTSLKDRLNHAMKMSEWYQGKSEQTDESAPQGGIMLKFKTPDVL